MYIGSTTKDYVSKRMVEHRNAYIEFKAGRVKNKTSVVELFDEFGIENCLIELIETCPCNSKDELRRREGEIIRASECVNKNVAGRTQKEWRDDTKYKRQEYARTYYETHKEQMQANETRKEQITAYYKIYNEKHKDFKKEYDRIYNETNKDKINEKRRAKYRAKAQM
jgi:hypothetical protein